MSDFMEFGKRMFRMNPVQFLSIIICLGLTMMAQQLAVNLSAVSLSTFISTELSHVFSGDLQHYLYNVLLSVVMYMIAGLLLAGVGWIYSSFIIGLRIIQAYTTPSGC